MTGRRRPLADPTPALVLGENLRRLKQERGLSLADIAERAEIHNTHVGLIMRGRRMVQVDTVLKLAGALGAEPGDLLRGVAWVPNEGPLRGGRYQLTDPARRPGGGNG